VGILLEAADADRSFTARSLKELRRGWQRRNLLGYRLVGAGSKSNSFVGSPENRARACVINHGMQTAFHNRQTALVTGGARGIGREVARQLARDGLRVLLGVRDLRRGEETAAALGGEVAAVELDMSSAASIAACARRLQGPIDVLVNNAGVYRSPREEIWAVNVRGPILLTTALDAALADEARVVNVTSGLGALSSQPTALQQRLADPSLTIEDLLQLPPGDYGESKAVLNSFTRLLAREWQRRLVNSVSPGWARTDMGGAGAPRSLDQGAASVLFCCRLRAGGPSGRVFEDGLEVGF
jgi:carbonyl reductase 1